MTKPPGCAANPCQDPRNPPRHCRRTSGLLASTVVKMDFNIDSEAAETSSLAELEPGSEAVVIDVDDKGPIGRRLLDLGLLPATPVKVLRRAPLGDPSVYELRGYRLCLRKGDAARVRVRFAASEALPSS